MLLATTMLFTVVIATISFGSRMDIVCGPYCAIVVIFLNKLKKKKEILSTSYQSSQMKILQVSATLTN